MADAALFQTRPGSVFEPTAAATGPWDRRIIHGAAVAALFAGQLTVGERALARLTVELLRPVPMAPLTLELSPLAGGSRLQRQEALLRVDGQTVATASSVVVRRGDLDLPPRALDHPSPFDPAAAPELREPNRASAELIGWDCFDSLSLIFSPIRVPGDKRTHQWIGLAVSVVEGTELQPTELAAIAADYAQSAVSRQLPYSSWSFRNADLTLHLAREPVGSWVGMRCESVIGAVGAGFNAADLYDAGGRMGRSAATLVVEHR